MGQDGSANPHSADYCACHFSHIHGRDEYIAACTSSEAFFTLAGRLLQNDTDSFATVFFILHRQIFSNREMCVMIETSFVTI